MSQSDTHTNFLFKVKYETLFHESGEASIKN